MQETQVQYIHQYFGVGVASFDLTGCFQRRPRLGLLASDVVVTIVVIIIDQSSARERNVLQRQRELRIGPIYDILGRKGKKKRKKENAVDE